MRPSAAPHNNSCTVLLAYVHVCNPAAVARLPSLLRSCDADAGGSTLLMFHNLADAGAATPDGSDPTDDISEKAKAGVDSVVGGLKDAAKKVTGGDK